MARVNIAAVTTLAFNTGIVRPTGTTIDSTAVSDGMYLAGGDLEPESLPANKGADLMVLIVSNTHASDDLTFTVKAGGAEPDTTEGFSPWPAFRASLGDLVVTVVHSASVPFLVGPLETSRFKQPNGDINIDLETAFVGTVQAILLPKAPYQ